MSPSMGHSVVGGGHFIIVIVVILDMFGLKQRLVSLDKIHCMIEKAINRIQPVRQLWT